MQLFDFLISGFFASDWFLSWENLKTLLIRALELVGVVVAAAAAAVTVVMVAVIPLLSE